MAMIEEMASFTIKELQLNKVEPRTEVDWSVIKNYLADKVK